MGGVAATRCCLLPKAETRRYIQAFAPQYGFWGDLVGYRVGFRILPRVENVSPGETLVKGAFMDPT